MDYFSEIHSFLTGPFLWVAFIVFICGSVYKIYTMFSLINKKERFIYTYMSLKFSLRSIIHWLIPFATVNWRRHPVMTIITFVFHTGLVIMPFFVSAHVVLLNNKWGLSWYSLPVGLTDSITLVVIICCIIFFIRRLVLKDIKFLTTPSDFFILGIAFLPFLTGYLAFHEVGNYHLWLLLHILSGEIMLMAIPFTRLSHMLFGVFTRAYIGSEFGGVRNAKDW